MVSALLITLREGLEAALIVGIVLAALRQLGDQQRGRFVWAGVLAAVAASAILGAVLQALGVSLEGRGEQIFEGLAMFLAAGVLSWMIFWMQRQGRQIHGELERSVRRAVSADSAGMLFGLAFVAVFREGLETALFLTAAAFGATPAETLIGGALGLLGAVALGWLIFVAGWRLDLRVFFRVTGLLLILVAAGLFAHGIHELEELGWLPSIVEHVWNLNPLLDENSAVGSLLKALFGYSSSPSLLRVLSYIGYLLAIWAANRLVGRTPASATRSE